MAATRIHHHRTTSPFVRAIEALGLDWVMTLKDNQPGLLAEAQRTTATQALHPPAADQSAELQLWYVPRRRWCLEPSGC
jgi:hypothetical protein